MENFTGQKRIIHSEKGFSIGEVVLSAFILAFTMVVLIRVLSVSLRDSMDSRDSIIASGLAQEGAELVRNLRDQNWAALGQAAGTNSFTGTGSSGVRLPVNSSDNCSIDISSVKVDCPAVGSVLNYTNYLSGYYYMYTGGTPTKFQRRINLAYDTGNAGTAATLTVNSMVIWKGASFPPTNALCTVGSGCVYTEIVLGRWME